MQRISGNTNDNEEIIPKYVNKLFKNILQKTRRIIIDIATLNEDIAYICEVRGKQYGYKSIKGYYLDEENQVKWGTIKSLFPSLHTIRIRSRVKIKNKVNAFKHSGTILLGDKIFEDIFLYLSTIKQKMKLIVVHNPLNSDSEIVELLQKYQTSYHGIQYKWVTEKGTDPQYGESKLMGVVPL